MAASDSKVPTRDSDLVPRHQVNRMLPWRFGRWGPAHRAALLALATAPSGGCGREDGQGNGEAAAAALDSSRRAPQPYTARALPAFGRVMGWVELDGPVPPDTTRQLTVDTVACGTMLAERTVAAQGNRIADVVVWIEGIRSGKPLPLERRYEVTNDRCALVPATQAAIAGGTLNVRSVDPVEHRTRIARHRTGDVVAVIRQTDQGQVVPNDRVLAEPGILALSCELHPWTRASIAVFDHPYFASSAADGAFALDSVPPGRYRIVAWHPRLGTVADSVTIGDGGEASIGLRLRAP